RVHGTRNMGRTLLRHVHEQRHYLLSRGFDVTVIGVANSKRFLLDCSGINLGRWREKLAASRRRMDLRTLACEIGKLELTDAAIVDCTAADSVVRAYPDFVRANLHIITPNKRANVLPWRRYVSLMNLLRQRQVYFFDEGNVGSGLRVM